MYSRTATAVACLTVALTAGTATAAPGDNVTLDPTATLVAQEAIVTSGTYRCSGTSPLEPVWITSTVKQGRTSVSGDAQQAVCDGQLRTWRVETDHKDVAKLRPGTATVQSTLMQLQQGQGFLPFMPAFLAASERQVEVTR